MSEGFPIGTDRSIDKNNPLVKKGMELMENSGYRDIKVRKIYPDNAIEFEATRFGGSPEIITYENPSGSPDSMGTFTIGERVEGDYEVQQPAEEVIRPPSQNENILSENDNLRRRANLQRSLDRLESISPEIREKIQQEIRTLSSQDDVGRILAEIKQYPEKSPRRKTTESIPSVRKETEKQRVERLRAELAEAIRQAGGVPAESMAVDPNAEPVAPKAKKITKKKKSGRGDGWTLSVEDKTVYGEGVKAYWMRVEHGRQQREEARGEEAEEAIQEYLAKNPTEPNSGRSSPDVVLARPLPPPIPNEQERREIFEREKQLKEEREGVREAKDALRVLANQHEMSDEERSAFLNAIEQISKPKHFTGIEEMIKKYPLKSDSQQPVDSKAEPLSHDSKWGNSINETPEERRVAKARQSFEKERRKKSKAFNVKEPTKTLPEEEKFDPVNFAAGLVAAEKAAEERIKAPSSQEREQPVTLRIPSVRVVSPNTESDIEARIAEAKSLADQNGPKATDWLPPPQRPGILRFWDWLMGRKVAPARSETNDQEQLRRLLSDPSVSPQERLNRVMTAELAARSAQIDRDASERGLTGRMVRVKEHISSFSRSAMVGIGMAVVAGLAFSAITTGTLAIPSIAVLAGAGFGKGVQDYYQKYLESRNFKHPVILSVLFGLAAGAIAGGITSRLLEDLAKVGAEAMAQAPIIPQTPQPLLPDPVWPPAGDISPPINPTQSPTITPTVINDISNVVAPQLANYTVAADDVIARTGLDGYLNSKLLQLPALDALNLSSTAHNQFIEAVRDVFTANPNLTNEFIGSTGRIVNGADGLDLMFKSGDVLNEGIFKNPAFLEQLRGQIDSGQYRALRRVGGDTILNALLSLKS